MTKAEALYQFFSSFGIDAYPSTAVPDDAIFPWLTYEPILGNKGDQVSITVDLWYHTTSEAVPNAKAEEIALALANGGKQIAYDAGMIWIKAGTPWCNPLTDENDRSVKRRLLNMELDYL